jgi:ectoine hydroxylase-related dioxygenase (phytanoyl-CoA dioxygenase family)
MNSAQQNQLDRDGFLVLPGVFPPAQVQQALARLESLWLEEGDEAGSENYKEAGARRLANLANKGQIFRDMLVHPAVLEVVEAVLGPDPLLSMLNARDALPGFAANPQPLHTDADHGGRADDRGYLACTAIWMLDPFTIANGATRLWPGSHRDTTLPKEAMADVRAAHPREVIVEGGPGDVLVFNGHCWHAGRPNTTGASRRAVLAHYVRGDQPQRLDQRAALAPEVQAALSPLERRLLGIATPARA